MKNRNREAIKAAKAILEINRLLQETDTVACMVLVDYVLEPFGGNEINPKRYSEEEVDRTLEEIFDVFPGEYETNELDHDDFASVDEYDYRLDDDDDDYTMGCMGDV